MDRGKLGKTINMTEGAPLKIMLRFAFPIFLSMVLQSLYNLMDTAIAGYILGDNALAAIGATGAVYNLHCVCAFTACSCGHAVDYGIPEAGGAGKRSPLHKKIRPFGRIFKI